MEIFVETEMVTEDVTTQVTKFFQTGDYEVCPPETMYWKHHPDVFGGYEGCVAERGLYPCASDALGVTLEGGDFYEQSPVYWDGEACVETSYSMSNRTFWILWRHPMDKHELNARAGVSCLLQIVILLLFVLTSYFRHAAQLSFPCSYSFTKDQSCCFVPIQPHAVLALFSWKRSDDFAR